MENGVVMNHRYILDENGEPVLCEDLMEWAMWMGTGERRVDFTDLIGIRVSTVFLGIDHNFSGHGPPVLWETMVFGEEEGGTRERRYTSRAEAIAGHAETVAAVKEAMMRRS
jgi:hypothetical protein